ncbi:MAG: hypothetical protein WC780_17405 [Lentimicrobiaceae bacterium]|jgi:hypothetical protein
MNKLFLTGFVLFLFLLGCEKEKETSGNKYVAQIVGFDLNCSTCIVMFPDDSLYVKREIGSSPNNYYHIINLNKGSYTIGQKLKVEVRKARENELHSCITLYPSYDYGNLYLLNYETFKDLVFNDTIDLVYKDCLYDSEMQTYICFDSVLTDSRCPIGAECIWEGEAAVRLRIEKPDSNPYFVDLYEHTTDTLVDGYEISFFTLFPYPVIDRQVNPGDYKARIVIKRN